MKKVLSIDGGGIRGILSAKIIQAIESGIKIKTGKTDVCIMDYFDCVVGVSTGGLVGACLTSKDRLGRAMSGKDIVDLYVKSGSKIFKKNWKARFSSWFDNTYSANGIESVLSDVFVNRVLSSVDKTFVATAYDLQSRKVVVFNSQDAKRSEDNDFLLRDVCRATSAAPTYFEPAKVSSVSGRNKYALIDGGVAGCNAALIGLVEANKMYPNEPIMVVSVGTGSDQEPYSYDQAKDWGKVEWIPRLTEIFLSANTDIVDYTLRRLYAENNLYFRIQPSLGNANPELDNATPENIAELVKAGNLSVSIHKSAIEKIVDLITE